MELTHGLRAALAATDSDRIVFDLSGVEDRYATLLRQLPGVSIRFAVKACPADEVIAALAARGAGCDAASPNEIAQALRAGVPAERIHYGNTSKSDRTIAEAFRLGVRDFATDSVQDVVAIAGHAPGSRVFCRLATSGEGALWGLTGKFGCSTADAAAVLETARELGLTAAGLSVHVGSQQMRAGSWRAAFDDLAQAISVLEERGIRLSYVNLGGGLPALGYLDRRGVPLEPPLDKIFATIRDGMQQLADLSASPLDFIAEPGRYLVADHGAIRAHVQRLSSRELVEGGAREHWLYLSAGKYNGLYEMDEVRYRLVFPGHEAEPGNTAATVPAVVAGPTCDSDDAFAREGDLVRVPASLASGDPVWILSCGAYATSYTTLGFNGIDPLPVEWVHGPRVRAITDADWAEITEIEYAAYAAHGLSEGREALESKARVSPETCFVVEFDGGIAGYVLSLPYPAGRYPALGGTDDLERGVDDDANLHLHDLVIAEPLRETGLARLLLRRLESAAVAGMYERISLVAVGASEGFWTAAGFRARREVDVPEGYGERALYMSKSVEVDRLAAYA